MERPLLSSPAQPSPHGRQAASPAPALTPADRNRPIDDKAGCTEWLVPEGVGRVLTDLVEGAGCNLLHPQYLTDVTNGALAGGGAGAQLSGVLAVKSGDILRVRAVTVASAPQPGAQPALGGEGYAAGGDSTGSSSNR